MVMNAALGNYMAGLIDGEGCFSILKRLGKTGTAARERGEVTYCCRFALKLRADDAAILEELACATRLGVIRAEERTGPRHPCVGWRIDAKAECAAFVRLLRQYPLRAKKAADFELWAEAVALLMSLPPKVGIHGGGCRRAEGAQAVFDAMSDLREALEATRTYDAPPISLPARAMAPATLFEVA